MTGLRSIAFAFLVASVLHAGAGRAAICNYSTGSSGDCNGIDSLSQAQACLSYATSFAADGVAKACVDQGGVTNFEGYLQPTYESAGTLRRYSESKVDAVLQFALDPTQPRSLELEQLIYEASLRQASAHGMFGDHQWVVGQNSRNQLGLSSTGSLQNPSYEALARLDSRVCQDEDDVPIQLTSAGSNQPALCLSDTDCQGGRVCRAARFNASDGLFGAVQEYRRGEQALLRAIRSLGLARFQELDATPSLGGRCPGGCASRLLLRLGALRSQAQARRLEKLWARAVAQGAVEVSASEGPATCVEPPSMEHRSCSLDRDCDELGGDGICGEERARAFVQLRQSADEALTESTLLLTQLGQVAPQLGDEDQAGVDFDLLEASQQSMTMLFERSEQSLTPFGIPSDVVPFFENTARELLQCEHTTRMSDCVLPLLQSQWLGVLGELETDEAAGSDRLDRYFDEAQNRDLYRQNAEGSFQEVLERMLGPACEGSCGCTPEEFEAGECLDMAPFGEWRVEGVDCDSQNVCSTQNVNGEFERQLQTLRTAELELQSLETAVDFLRRKERQIVSNFAAINEIDRSVCAEVQAAVINAGNAVNTELMELKDSYKVRKVSGGEIFNQLVSGGVNIYKQYTKGLEKAAQKASFAGVVLETAGGIVKSISGAVVAKKNARLDAEEKRARTETQAAIRAIETAEKVEIGVIQCLAESAMTELERDDALFELQGERRRVLAQLDVQRSRIIEAKIAANQMIETVRRARRRYDEATALRDIWDADDFRNPQNYRVLALDAELDAADRLKEARLVTWIMLRAAAYDLAQPDFVSPLGASWGQALPRYSRLDSCDEWNYQANCDDFDDESTCSLGPLLPPVGEVYASDGSCSLQAVFHADSSQELRSLVREARVSVALESGSQLCSNGSCFKDIKLRELFTDAMNPDRQTLGDILGARNLSLDFSVALDRNYRVCTQASDTPLDMRCDPIGVAGLGPDRINNPEFPATLGTGASDTFTVDRWNARIWEMAGDIDHLVEAKPDEKLCRDSQGYPVLPRTPCNGSSDCNTSGGGCYSLTSLDPGVFVRPLGSGLLRARNAECNPQGDPDFGARDSLVSYRPQRIDDFLPGESLRQRNPFAVSLALPETLLERGPGEEQEYYSNQGRGLPVANTRWRVEFRFPSGLSAQYHDAYLASIEDIKLKLTYDAFVLDENGCNQN